MIAWLGESKVLYIESLETQTKQAMQKASGSKVLSVANSTSSSQGRWNLEVNSVVPKGGFA